MNHGPLQHESPERLYTVIGDRDVADTAALDSVTLVVSECEPAPGMQSEHSAILRMCARPTAVVEIAAELGLPVSVVRTLLLDLLGTGWVRTYRPVTPDQRAEVHDHETLKQVLLALQRL